MIISKRLVVVNGGIVKRPSQFIIDSIDRVHSKLHTAATMVTKINQDINTSVFLNLDYTDLTRQRDYYENLMRIYIRGMRRLEKLYEAQARFELSEKLWRIEDDYDYKYPNRV